jgi:hypothetical protein
LPPPRPRSIAAAAAVRRRSRPAVDTTAEVARDRIVGVDGERLLHLVGGFAVAALGRLADGLVEERFGAPDQTGVARPRCRSTARILAHRWFTSWMKDALLQWYLAHAMDGLRL